MKSYQVRTRAKEFLTGGWKTFAFTSLLYLVFLLLVSYVPRLLKVPYILCIILQNGCNIFFSYGLFSVFWHYSRGQDVRFFDFAIIALKNIKRAFLLFFYTALRLILPFLGVIISTVLIASSVTGSLIYASQDLGSSQFLIAVFIISIILAVVSYVVFFVKSLYYVFSNLIAIEHPELSEKDCVIKSKEMMKGHRIQYLKLLFSFIGWFIVGIFTLLIGFIWIFPYLQMSIIAFYEIIKNGEINKKKKHRNKKKK